MKTYNYIIVGAGSAGCILANKLSANTSNSVLLIEGGGKNKSILIDMPTALSYPMNTKKYNWGFKSQREPHLSNRILDCPRGRGLGGSSAINGMVYVRGNPHDFDEWSNCGAEGWDYYHCLPYFKRLENWINGEDSYRSNKGPVSVGMGNKMRKNPLYNAFIQAGIEAGYSYTSDYNGYKQEGFGPMQMNVGKGIRCSSSRVYLSHIKKRRNLTIITDSLVDKIYIENSKAKAVRVFSSGKENIYNATKEVILSAGAIGTPCILQRSGIGNGNLLSQLNIKIVKDLPGVGQNLQDHLEVYFQYRCIKPITLNSKMSSFRKLLIGIRWIFFKNGLGATNHFESCAFIRSKCGIISPDIQYHFMPAAVRYDGKKAVKGHGFQVHVGPNKPKSRGHVNITSPLYQDPPEILFNYLQSEDDKLDWRSCIRLTKEIMEQPAMDCYRGDLIQPNINISSSEEIDKWVKNNVESAYHPCGSCKMGKKDDKFAVVDNECKVIGIDGLRVVDASIFPTITNGNLNAPTMMVAEKASDIILGINKPTISKVRIWEPINWKKFQRDFTPSRTI